MSYKLDDATISFSVIDESEIDKSGYALELIRSIRSEAAKALFDNSGWVVNPGGYSHPEKLEFLHRPTGFVLWRPEGVTRLMHSHKDITFPAEGIEHGLVHPDIRDRIPALYDKLKAEAIARISDIQRDERILSLKGLSYKIQMARKEYEAPPNAEPIKFTFWQRVKRRFS